MDTTAGSKVIVDGESRGTVIGPAAPGYIEVWLDDYGVSVAVTPGQLAKA